MRAERLLKSFLFSARLTFCVFAVRREYVLQQVQTLSVEAVEQNPDDDSISDSREPKHEQYLTHVISTLLIRTGIKTMRPIEKSIC